MKNKEFKMNKEQESKDDLTNEIDFNVDVLTWFNNYCISNEMQNCENVKQMFEMMMKAENLLIPAIGVDKLPSSFRLGVRDSIKLIDKVWKNLPEDFQTPNFLFDFTFYLTRKEMIHVLIELLAISNVLINNNLERIVLDGIKKRKYDEDKDEQLQNQKFIEENLKLKEENLKLKDDFQIENKKVYQLQDDLEKNGVENKKLIAEALVCKSKMEEQFNEIVSLKEDLKKFYENDQIARFNYELVNDENVMLKSEFNRLTVEIVSKNEEIEILKKQVEKTQEDIEILKKQNDEKIEMKKQPEYTFNILDTKLNFNDEDVVPQRQSSYKKISYKSKTHK